MTRLLSLAAFCAGLVGLLGCLGVIEPLVGTRSCACGIAATALGGTAFLEAQLSRRRKLWSVVSVLGIAMGVAVLVAHVQAG